MRRPTPSDLPKRNATLTGQRVGQATVSFLRQPVAKDSLVSLVIARIRDALLRKDLKPGDYLPSEFELSRRLGVGKSRIREAVKIRKAAAGPAGQTRPPERRGARGRPVVPAPCPWDPGPPN